MRCHACRAAFRVPPGYVPRQATCPACGDALTRLTTLPTVQMPRRAAEGGAAYATPVPGERFGHFELISVLGRGGAGKVYRARNTRTNHEVALKLLDVRPLDSAEEVDRRLHREVTVARRVRHEHVVGVFDAGMIGGVPYMEMEFVPGGALRDEVHKRVRLPAGQAVELCCQALEGLHGVHRLGMVHGDVKPANILLDADGRARVTDFGLSRFLEETTSASDTTGLVGSPYYLAPECWTGAAATPAADIYAMGLVLYFALTGRHPWQGRSPAAIMCGHLQQPLLPQGEQHPFIPAYLADVIRRASAKLPAQRFGDAAEFAESLSAFE
jgi:serine/threonine-protein kinase